MTEVRQFESAEDLARGAALFFASVAEESLRVRGRFSVALAGGSTPERAYRLLAEPPLRDRIDWTRTEIFFGDERAVHIDHPDCNYRMADQALLSKVPVQETNIHRMEAERTDLEQAARDYEKVLRDTLGTTRASPPRLDLILLGIGLDGHTASIFPGTEEQARGPELVTHILRTKQRGSRLTLTFPILNDARNVVFLVSGSAKAKIVSAVLEGHRGGDLLPPSRVVPEAGTLTFMLDRDAAPD